MFVDSGDDDDGDDDDDDDDDNVMMLLLIMRLYHRRFANCKVYRQWSQPCLPRKQSGEEIICHDMYHGWV